LNGYDDFVVAEPLLLLLLMLGLGRLRLLLLLLWMLLVVRRVVRVSIPGGV